MLSSVETTREEKTPGGAVVYASSFFRSDDALLSGVVRGERGACAVFYQRYVDDVEECVYRTLGTDVAGSKIVSNVFLKALKQLPAGKAVGSLRRWLLRLTIRELRRTLRFRRIRLLLGFGVGHTQSVSVASDASAATDVPVALSSRHRVSTQRSKAGSERSLATAGRVCAAAGGRDARTPETSVVLTKLSSSVAAELVSSSGEPSQLTWFEDMQGSDRSEAVVVQREFYRLLDGIAPTSRIAFCLHIVGGMDLGEVAELCDCSLSATRNRVADAKARFLQAAENSHSLRCWLAEAT